MSGIINLKCSTEFCPSCGSHITLPIYGDYIECNQCQTKIPLTDCNFEPVSTRKVYNKPKEWLIDYNKHVKRLEGEEDVMEEEQTENRQIITQQCIKSDCDSNQCYYRTLQTRSADEGQTIFCQCVKCGEKFVLYA